MPWFNPRMKDDRLLPGYTFSRREVPKKKKQDTPKEELISTESEHVLSMEADTRKEWFQLALMQVAAGQLKAASLQDVMLEPSFASTQELRSMVEANMHFFTPKLQKALKRNMKNAPIEAAKSTSSKDEKGGPESAEKSIDSASVAQPEAERRRGVAKPGGGGAAGRRPASSSRSPSPRDRPQSGTTAGISVSRALEEGGSFQELPLPSRRRGRRDIAEDSRSRSPRGSLRCVDDRSGPHRRSSRAVGDGGAPRHRRSRCRDLSESRDGVAERRPPASRGISERSDSRRVERLPASAPRCDRSRRGPHRDLDSDHRQAGAGEVRTNGDRLRRSIGRGSRPSSRGDSRDGWSPAPEFQKRPRRSPR